MDQISSLVMFCVVMFGGAFLSGYIPLSMNISESRLRTVTIFGAGLLVGTALIVIIPEGVAMHYEAQTKHEALHAADRAASLAAAAAHSSLRPPPGVVVLTADAPSSAAAAATAAAAAAAAAAAGASVLLAEGTGHGHGHGAGDASAVQGAHGGPGAAQAVVIDGHDISHEHPGHWQIGAALAFGFAFQLVVDRLSGDMHGHSHSVPSSPSLAGGGGGGGVGSGSGAGATAGSPDSAGEGSGGSAGLAMAEHSAKGKSAMVGMVVHAAVDGVALGAAVREGDQALGWLVFMAIILHKFPSAFGLSSYLLHHGISHDGVRKRMLVFSSAAPIGTVVTYTVLSARMFTYQQEMLALCLLFSGGTFLYVATAHVLPEIQSGGHGAGSGGGEGDDEDDDERGGGAHHGHSHAGGAGGGGGGGGGAAKKGKGNSTPPRMRWSEVGILVAGVLLPLFAPVHHGH